jgi:hypothetical protein
LFGKRKIHVYKTTPFDRKLDFFCNLILGRYLKIRIYSLRASVSFGMISRTSPTIP